MPRNDNASQPVADVSSYLKTAYSYFSSKPVSTKQPAPTTTPQVPPPKKKPRDVFAFAKNITASIALPDVSKKHKKMDILNQDLLTTLYHSVTDSFFKPSTTVVDNKSDNQAANQKIVAQIETLERQRQDADGRTPELEDKLLLKEVELLEYEIREHAARRVDLFFYLLIAVYNTHVIVTKGATTKQHGRGSKERNTQACHSSLFPGVKLTHTPSYLSSSHDLIGTFFEEALNMTVELPAIVNAFDGHLEGRYEFTRHVETCLDILNDTSRGIIDPIQGMNRFFREMGKFFDRYEKNQIKKGKTATPNTNRRIWQYEKEATFSAANQDLTLNYDYLYLMLRLTPNEIRTVTWTPVGSLYLSRCFSRIQNEIYAANPSQKKTGLGHNN